MKNVTAKSNSTLIIIYGIVAVFFIIVFQSYWLYSIYKDQKKIVLDEVQNIVKEYIFANDVLVFSTKMESSKLEFSLNNPSMVGVHIEITDDTVGDKKAIFHKIVDPFYSKKKVSLDKKLFKKMKSRLNKALPGLIVLPDNKYHKYGETITISSEINPSQEHSVTLLNVKLTVLKKIWPSVIISLLYLIVCIGAVVLLIKNIRKSRKLMEQKNNFTNNMTHELKTPLATLYAATEALDKYNVLDDKVASKEYIRIMQNDLKRLTDMTESILYNAKLSDGRIYLKTESLNLKMLLKDVAATLRPRIEQMEASVDYEKVPDNIFIEADKEHMFRVFTNLIDNSLKYAHTKPIINIAADRDENVIRIVITDNGIGIPLKYHKDIFKPYFRVSEGNMHKVKGYGLGLSYAKEIMTLHRGEIVLLSSDEGKGSAFGITIPVGNG